MVIASRMGEMLFLIRDRCEKSFDPVPVWHRW